METFEGMSLTEARLARVRAIRAALAAKPRDVPSVAEILHGVDDEAA